MGSGRRSRSPPAARRWRHSTASTSCCWTSSFPDTSGLDVLDAIRSRPAPPAVILVTAHGNESLAAAALRRGADDYLAKDAALAELLPQILERVRRNRELRKALAAAEQDLVRAERLAAIGEMTVTLHHEINNPLMAAFADVELLLSDVNARTETAAQGLSDIKQALRGFETSSSGSESCGKFGARTTCAGVQMLDLERQSRSSPALEPGHRAAAPSPTRTWPGSCPSCCGGPASRSNAAPVSRSCRRRRRGIGISVVVVAGGAGHPGGAPAWRALSPASDRDYLMVALVAGDGAAATAAGADHVVHAAVRSGNVYGGDTASAVSRLACWYAIPCSRMIRWRIGGWEPKKSARNPSFDAISPGAGSTMQRCAGPAGDRLGGGGGRRPASPARLASAIGLRVSWAPVASARYSRFRLTAMASIRETTGATTSVSSQSTRMMIPSGLPPRPLPRRPAGPRALPRALPPRPIIRPMPSDISAIAPTMPASRVMSRTSRFRTWAISWATTAWSSSRESVGQQSFGHRDAGRGGVAAGGEGVGIGVRNDPDPGLGSPDAIAISSTTLTSCFCSGVAGSISSQAPVAQRTFSAP